MANENYSIVSKGGVGEFSIFDPKNNYITVFSYKSWFSSSGSAPIKEGVIEIKSKNAWESSFTIFLDGKEIGDLQFNWRGNIVITLDDLSGKRNNFLLKNVSLKFDWVLEDESEQPVLKLHCESHWTKLNYRYDVEVIDNHNTSINTLLVACGYGTNLNMSMISSLMA